MKHTILFTLLLLTGMHLISFGQTPEDNIGKLGITLPEPSTPVANYVKYVKTGNLIFLSGHGPCSPGKNGKVGKDLSVDEGYEAARNTAICLLSTLKGAVGDLSKVKRIVRVFGMVNATPDFTDHSKVINGCSDLLTEVFGEDGKHVRAAVGMASLPGNIPVEIEMIVELKEE
jgi:enamine deaminase RidA (YjgF/YER057c/UK114 family)